MIKLFKKPFSTLNLRPIVDSHEHYNWHGDCIKVTDNITYIIELRRNITILGITFTYMKRVVHFCKPDSISENDKYRWIKKQFDTGDDIQINLIRPHWLFDWIYSFTREDDANTVLQLMKENPNRFVI